MQCRHFSRKLEQLPSTFYLLAEEHTSELDSCTAAVSAGLTNGICSYFSSAPSSMHRKRFFKSWELIYIYFFFVCFIVSFDSWKSGVRGLHHVFSICQLGINLFTAILSSFDWCYISFRSRTVRMVSFKIFDRSTLPAVDVLSISLCYKKKSSCAPNATYILW